MGNMISLETDGNVANARMEKTNKDDTYARMEKTNRDDTYARIDKTNRDDTYAQMDKNTVEAQNQLRETDFVTFENPRGKGPRVLIMGNSITLHEVLPKIGWNYCWGMAASSREKDYVHQLLSLIGSKEPDAAFCICQVSEWESRYQKGSEMLHLYEAAREFEADLIVMRFIENCPKTGFDGECFKQELDKLLDYVNSSKEARIILTTGFWKHPGDQDIMGFAKEHEYPVVYLGDLGEDDRMKAIGLFEHAGVANHPGDLGMKRIAERIYEAMEKMADKP